MSEVPLYSVPLILRVEAIFRSNVVSETQLVNLRTVRVSKRPTEERD